MANHTALILLFNVIQEVLRGEAVIFKQLDHFSECFTNSVRLSSQFKKEQGEAYLVLVSCLIKIRPTFISIHVDSNNYNV